MSQFKRKFLSLLSVKSLVYLIALKLVLLWLVLSLFDFSKKESAVTVNHNSLNNDTILLSIPEMTVYNESDLFLLAEKESNLALNYWLHWSAINKENVWSDKKLNVCSNVTLPKPEKIQFNNIYFQQFDVNRNVTLYLYNAYLDNRRLVSTVKIIAMTDNQLGANSTNLWCFLWFENYRKPLLTKVSSIYIFCPWKWCRKLGHYGPLYIECEIPITLKHLVPKAVSLTMSGSCVSNKYIRLTHNLRVIYNKADVRQEFAVCVQALRFDSVDYSVRLIEWLEMLKILGANKVFLYKLGAHPNMVKVLQYYSKQNFVDWRQLTLANKQLNNGYLYQWYYDKVRAWFWPQEMLELNDCLYRNMYNYKYIAVIDVDELIIPINAYNWSQLMTEVQGSINNEQLVKSLGYYENINSHFYVNLETNKMAENENEENSEILSNIPSYMFTMRHVYRKNFTKVGINVKCFINTDVVEATYWHLPHKCIIGRKKLYWSCNGHVVNTNQSFLFHYKREYAKPKECNNTDMKECANYDTTMWKYYKQLNNNMKIVLEDIFS